MADLPVIPTDVAPGLPADPPPPVIRSEGVTHAERYLGKLCQRSFLSLWSYPGVHRQDRGLSKELCDLLVVFENHVVIFSDKDCRFQDTGSLERDWARWYKKAVLKSAEQVWGAERWMRESPGDLFLDKDCKIPFPLNLPDPTHTIFHRIVVAHDGARRCREVLGGSGSLMLNTGIVGNAHLDHPFTIGRIDAKKGYVHVFDDTTLEIVLSTLDTITDFTMYLTKKEQFLTGERVVTAAGEEELLAIYLTKMNRAGEHDFVIDGNYNAVHLLEGFWERFTKNPQRLAQIEHDRISYAWDRLIEKFAFHAMTGTQYFTSGKPVRDQEIMFRFMAREPRTVRRILATSIHEVLRRSLTSGAPWEARIMTPFWRGDPHYVFLVMPERADLTRKEYREMRVQLLSIYCRMAKLKFPDATHIIGIATEDAKVTERSEDMLYLDASDWGPEQLAETRKLQESLGILKNVNVQAERAHEYPVNPAGRPLDTTLSRNSTCRCGSGKRFKRCCGKGLFDKRRHD